jgi:hypothetical protein
VLDVPDPVVLAACDPDPCPFFPVREDDAEPVAWALAPLLTVGAVSAAPAVFAAEEPNGFTITTAAVRARAAATDAVIAIAARLGRGTPGRGRRGARARGGSVSESGCIRT